jgi:hypothetical protein
MSVGAYGDLSAMRPTLMQMLAMRLHAHQGEVLPFRGLHLYREEDTVFVFFVHNGKPVVLEDGWPLFPSDQLISQLRLLHG